MIFTEIDKILDQVIMLFHPFDDENFDETIKNINFLGNIVKSFKKDNFRNFSANEREKFEKKTKQIKNLFDDKVLKKRTEMEEVSLQLKKIVSQEKTNIYRSA